MPSIREVLEGNAGYMSERLLLRRLPATSTTVSKHALVAADLADRRVGGKVRHSLSALAMRLRCVERAELAAVVRAGSLYPAAVAIRAISALVHVAVGVLPEGLDAIEVGAE